MNSVADGGCRRWTARAHVVIRQLFARELSILPEHGRHQMIVAVRIRLFLGLATVEPRHAHCAVFQNRTRKEAVLGLGIVRRKRYRMGPGLPVIGAARQISVFRICGRICILDFGPKSHELPRMRVEDKGGSEFSRGQFPARRRDRHRPTGWRPERKLQVALLCSGLFKPAQNQTALRICRKLRR